MTSRTRRGLFGRLFDASIITLNDAIEDTLPDRSAGLIKNTKERYKWITSIQPPKDPNQPVTSVKAIQAFARWCNQEVDTTDITATKHLPKK